MKTKLTIGWLKQRLPLVVNYHRLKMTYSSVQETTGGFFNKKTTNTPWSSNNDYWVHMCMYYPWNKLLGANIQIETLPEDTEIWLDAEAVAKILVATGEFKS
jgi:hypothetical protein